MDTSNIAHEIASLPPEAQKQVMAFVALLKTRYPVASLVTKQSKLIDEPFIGMWKDREDLQDSIAWVKGIRCREWEDDR
jgi:hypothetical protein